MYLIAGLGNPTKEFENTRHNAGFAVIDRLAKDIGTDVAGRKMKGLYGIGAIAGEKVILVKPQTYMNLSGECIQAYLQYYKLPLGRLVVVYDDVNLPPGRLRIRENGSAGGHNGMKNIIAMVGGQGFPRLRIGIGEKPPRVDMIDYVLGRFPKSEAAVMDECFHRAVDALKTMVSQGPAAAMNIFNRAASDAQGGEA
ncbi:MAG: aminoacyl-tRNA hydrolase [Lachnospiraceae bacterium]|jgi:PTH1 family peptidyl-tRNA hydrolase|nr:aminoacyl-tRNA hydrolase [Lachnospiraceae bacterium]